MSVPLWKVKRELLRLVTQLRGLPRIIIWYLFATPYHDRVLAKHKRHWNGAQAHRATMAIYVIYPSDGLEDSHLLTLAHMAENGYATLVVSNLPLSDDDRARLLQHCARYIERRNFGYDFGAYRDGILSLADTLAHLDRLVLINDSVWYPLPDRSNWLADSEAMGLDFVGAVSNYGTPRTAYDTFRTLEWTYRSDHPNFHYCSFALNIGPKILKSPRFMTFWKSFRLENDKKRVVRRGEIGLTQWVLRNGFSHGCTCNPGDLPSVLHSLSDSRLQQIVQRAIFPEYWLGQSAKQAVMDLFDTDPNWREVATRYVLMAATTQGTGYALAELTINELRFPFLKKSPLRLSKSGSDISMMIVSQLGGEVGNILTKEARRLQQRRTTEFDVMENQSTHGK